MVVIYVLILGIVFILWFLYVIVCYLDVYDIMYIWGGWYFIVLIISDISYCIKFIVFMLYNYLFRKVILDVVFESLRMRVIWVKRVLFKIVRKVDGVIFFKMGDDVRIFILRKIILFIFLVVLDRIFLVWIVFVFKFLGIVFEVVFLNRWLCDINIMGFI